MIKIISLVLCWLSITCNTWAISPAFLGNITNAASGGATDFTADANCQAAWLFADNLNDSSGEGNTLTAADNATYTTDRPDGFSTGKSMDLNGSSDYFTIATENQSADLPGKAQKEDVTVCSWYYNDVSTAGDIIVSLVNGFVINIKFDNTINVLLKDQNNDTANVDIVTGVEGDWVHICVSFDGSTTDTTSWVSTDGGSFGGVLNGGVDDFANVNNIRADGSTSLAGNNQAHTSPFDGHIYQTIVFDRTISTSEAEEMYDTGITGAD